MTITTTNVEIGYTSSTKICKVLMLIFIISCLSILLLTFIISIKIPKILTKNILNDITINKTNVYTNLITIQYDEHLFIIYKNKDQINGIIHHPDCPCLYNQLVK